MIAFDVAYVATLGLLAARTGDRRAVVGAWWAVIGVYLPSSTVGLWNWPGWQSMYLFDLDGGGVSLGLAVVGQAIALVATFRAAVFLGPRLRGWSSTRVFIVLATAWVGVMLTLFAILADRAFRVATYGVFHADPSVRVDLGAAWPVLIFLGVTGAANAAAGILIARGVASRRRSGRAA
jgi:hypothetical protein